MDLSKSALQSRVNKCLEALSEEIANEIMNEYPGCRYECGMGSINIYNNKGEEVGVKDMRALWETQYGAHKLEVSLNVEMFLKGKVDS